MSHILLLPFGTSGSVFPFIWLGRNLVERGHRVTMVASTIYHNSATAAGILFFPAEPDELLAMLTDPGLWSEGACMKVAFTYGVRAIGGSAVTIVDRALTAQAGVQGIQGSSGTAGTAGGNGIIANAN